MSRKHFIAIAKILRTSVTKDEIVSKLCTYFATVNSNFDRDRFKGASHGYY
jgi:hypothetical protein